MDGTALFQFPRCKQYAFIYENAHLVLFNFDRDDAKFLFLIRDETEDGWALDYPGDAFSNRVMDEIQNIFFIQVHEDEGEAGRYVLGSLFEVGGRRFGAYYGRDVPESNVLLFKVTGEAPELQLELIEGQEYEQAAEAFAEQHEGFLEARRQPEKR